ncbi:hypothetical protein EKO27_g6286, partial [Xylaria grammica]
MDPVIPAIPSARLPVLGPDVVRLIRMIDNGESYRSIFYHLHATTSLMRNAALPPEVSLEDAFILFHSLSRPLLRSLLMGTLGPHFYSRNAKRHNYDTSLYDDNYAGAYAVSLHVKGRRGAFLSQRETRELIVALNMYADGVSVYDDVFASSSTASGRQRDVLEFTQAIDDELRATAIWDPDADDPLRHVLRPRFA